MGKVNLNAGNQQIEPVWRTSVDEVLRVFHDALEALLPLMDRAHIPWREGEAYDDWDAIAETLFQRIVGSAIEWGLHDTHESVCLPKYDELCLDYSELSFISVAHRTRGDDETLALHSFAEDGTSHLNLVMCRSLERAGAVAESDLRAMPYVDAEFHLKWRRPDGSWAVVRELEVVL